MNKSVSEDGTRRMGDDTNDMDDLDTAMEEDVTTTTADTNINNEPTDAGPERFESKTPDR